MTPQPQRLGELDLFKTMLVMGMVLIHVLQLLTLQMPRWTAHAENTINLLTFSGFLLAMGIGLGVSRGRARPLPARLRPVAMLLVATWISSFAFALLVDRGRLDLTLALDVLTMRRLFGWSEFLASFTMLYALVAVGRPALIWVASRPVALLLATVLCLASTWLIVDADWPLSATLFGTTHFASFPLLAYFPWFLLGIALGRDGIRLTPWHGLVALMGTGWLIWFMSGNGWALPGRFPPTVTWVVGPALLLWLYLVVAQAISRRFAVPSWASVPGRHVLSYLLVSNLAIFTTRNLVGKPLKTVLAWVLVAAGLIVVIAIGWLLIERWRASRPAISADRAAGGVARP